MTPVVWTRAALVDLNAILDQAALKNIKGAAKIAKRVEDAEKALAVFPRSSRYNAETGTYEAIVRGVPLLLIYELKSTSEESERVEIIAVFYTARHPNSKPGRRSA